jgi:hypothetical protein
MKASPQSFVQKHAPALCDVLVALRPHNLPVLNVNLVFKATGLNPDGSWRTSQPNQLPCDRREQDLTESDPPRVR